MASLSKSLSFSYGRKRILVSKHTSDSDSFSDVFDLFTPKKRRSDQEPEPKLKPNCSSLLEALPLEILIKVICGVDHDDLEQLSHVSKTIRNASIIAKQTHFAYRTPPKFRMFRNSIDMEAPNAPIQSRRTNRPQIDKRKLGKISVALFFGDDDQSQRGARRSSVKSFFKIFV